jgi:Plasmid encoded RepA protein
LRHMHSVLAICGLPYERLPVSQRDYSRKQGNMALDITSGTLRDGNGTPHVQPVPFGPKARLVLMHLCSEAVRQKSSTIEIADSLTGFVRDMGFSDSGGRKGPMTAFKEQLNALAAASMRISVWEEDRVRMRNITPIEQMDLWLPTHPNQRSLWPSTVTFSDAMFKSIMQRSMPLNRHVIKALAGSARKLDLYFWLNWRMHNLDGPLRLSWSAIYDQFGGENRSHRDFKRHFKADLADLQEILTKLPAHLTEHGLTILPADPDVLALPSPRPTTLKKS